MDWKEVYMILKKVFKVVIIDVRIECKVIILFFDIWLVYGY